MSATSRELARSMLLLVSGAAAYGFAAGSGHDLLYAGRDAVKFPLLLLVTAAICAASFQVVALTFQLRLSWLATQRLAFALFRDAALLLASLAPIVLFLALVLRTSDDGARGEYDFFLAANMTAIALAGTLALLRQVRTLRSSGALPPRRALAISGCWLLLALLVGGQAAFWMRPFYGYPATRGVRPPWFLGREPDLRGATNFFEALDQAVRRLPLPTDLEQRIRRLSR